MPWCGHTSITVQQSGINDGSCSIIDKLFKLQKRAARMITRVRCSLISFDTNTK